MKSPKRICLRGHDTHVTGRSKAGHCVACRKDQDKRRLSSEQWREKRRASNRRWHRAKAGCVDATGEQVVGLCAICQRHSVLHWDHDHGTGAKRGWLCPTCNTGLGLMQDSEAVLKAALVYLASFRID